MMVENGRRLAAAFGQKFFQAIERSLVASAEVDDSQSVVGLFAVGAKERGLEQRFGVVFPAIIPSDLGQAKGRFGANVGVGIFRQLLVAARVRAAVVAVLQAAASSKQGEGVSGLPSSPHGRGRGAGPGGGSYAGLPSAFRAGQAGMGRS